MGIKFQRKYEDIINDMISSVEDIDNLYDFIDMKQESWNSMRDEQRQACIKTMADDLLYGLGYYEKIDVGSGQVIYDSEKEIIKVKINQDYLRIINLV